MIIEDENAAPRLASAVLADVSLYNSDRMKHAMDPERDLADVLGEARALFRSRVAPALHPIFEEAVGQWAIRVRGDATPTPPPKRDESVDEAMREAQERLDAAVAKRSRQSLIAGFVIVAVVVSAIVSYELVTYKHHDDEHEPGGHHDDPNKHEGHSRH